MAWNYFRQSFAVGAVLVLSACGEDPQPPNSPLTLLVDATLVPNQATIPDPDSTAPPRDLERMLGVNDVAMDFVANELLVGTADQTALDAFLLRWGGTVLRSTTAVGDVPPLHLVEIDPSTAQIDALLAELNGAVPELTGTFTASSDRAAQLLAVALTEAHRGEFTVTPNFVAPLNGIPEGTTTEAPSGDSGFNRDAFALPYIDRGSAQDIGVGAAWQALSRAGKLGNEVRMLVLDGGFAQNADFPTRRSVVGSWDTPSLLSCAGGASCPWHGAMVVNAAMGSLDNSFGAAGPAAPVARLIAVPFQSDVFGVLTTLERIVAATVFGDPRIINMSFGFELDLGWDIAVKAACLGLCPSPSEVLGSMTFAVANTGKLLFASAGNAGKDVDNGRDIIEGSNFVPCELPGVICVGGMAHDAITRAPGSNFGSKTGETTVDIYGPYSVWVGSDPDNPANVARLVNGTSFASPFVAGVAALVWAANPSLSANAVWGILRDTAHVGGVGVTGNQRRINAFGAIADVVGGDPPQVSLSTPVNPQLNRRIDVTAQVTDDSVASATCPPSACPLTWDPVPAAIVGNTAHFRFDTTGNKTIRVTAQDPVEQTASASIVVNVINSAPVVSISQPTAGATIPQGVSLQLLGSALDQNEGPDPGPGAIACTWTSSSSGDTAFPRTGCDTSAVFTSTGPRTLTLRASDPELLSAVATVAITVTAPPTNLPPVITIGTLAPPVNYEGGYAWMTTLTASASATDPEGNTPISYTWRATSFRPDSATVYAANVVVQGPSASPSLNWKPDTTPALLGDEGMFGNACFNGQIVRLTLEASDSLGNRSTRTLPDITIYRCILG